MDNRNGGQRDWDADRWPHTTTWPSDPNDSLPPTRLVGPPPFQLPSRKAMLLVGLATALVIVMIGTAFLLNATAAPRVVHTQPTPTVSSLLSGTPISQGATATPVGAISTPHPAPGWVNAGPAFAQNITFAPSDPNTMYVCGNRQYSGSGAASLFSTGYGSRPFSSLNALQFTVGASHDGGVTWGLSQPPAQGNSCAMLISPVNPQSAVLVASVCTGCQRSTLYRTDDGGQTWVALSLPPNGALDSTQFDAVVWVRGTLFATPFSDPTIGPPAHFLAESAAGGPFTWVDTTGLFTAATQTQQPQLIGEGSTLYAILAGNPCSQCTVLAVSTNNGVTWSHFLPRDQNTSLRVIGGSRVNGTLYGTISVDAAFTPLERSTDGGITWHPMPNPPSLIAGDNYLDTPDGTFFADFGESISGFVPGIYRFDPPTASWRQSAAFPIGDSLVTVQVNAQGHPTAIWGQNGFDPTSELQYPGLQRHAP